MATIDTIEIEVITTGLNRARNIIKELKALGLRKKTLNLMIKDIYKK